jgi:predicted anti-sigma-YlaC factor YlaD
MRPRDLTCQELVEIVTAYLEGTFPAIERASFEAHLAVCQGCRTYLDQMRRTIAVVGTLNEESLSANDRDRLLNLFRTWKQATS